MEIESSAEIQGLPAWCLIPANGPSTADTPIGEATPPFRNMLLDVSGRTAIAVAQRAPFNHTPSSVDGLISAIVRNFSAWVLDLPASENHHHACPNGLYRHSLETASYAALDLHERWSLGHGVSVLTPAEQALWLMVTFALGLFHDCGKLLDIDVRISGSGPCSNPLGESLAAFKAGHGVDTLAPTPHQFRPGRGLTGHERKGVSLLPVILAGPNWEWLRLPLAEAFAALAFRHQVPMEGFEVPLAYVAERVHRADVRSARRGRKLRRNPNPARVSGQNLVVVEGNR